MICLRGKSLWNERHAGLKGKPLWYEKHAGSNVKPRRTYDLPKRKISKEQKIPPVRKENHYETRNKNAGLKGKPRGVQTAGAGRGSLKCASHMHFARTGMLRFAVGRVYYNSCSEKRQLWATGTAILCVLHTTHAMSRGVHSAYIFWRSWAWRALNFTN